jgi:hypothetical protein
MGTIAEPDGGTLACSASERAFNGACRKVCTSTSQCGREYCAAIDATTAVCVPYPNCAWLGSDTQCLGVGKYEVYTRGGMASVPYASFPYDANPYDVTPYDDPYFAADGAYAYGATDGCRGNARYVVEPARTDPGCGQSHAVNRCRRFGTRCGLAAGTTKDVVSP